MAAFNWEYVYAHPAEFVWIWAQYSVHAFILSAQRLLTAFRSHPTNYVTALKSLLLRTFFRRNWKFLYTASSAAINACRRIDGNGWEAYEVEPKPNIPLRKSDAVILYFHGGGYILGHPLQYYRTYLRWKTKAAQSGLHLAIVALRYRKPSESLSRCCQRILRTDSCC